MDIRLIDEKNLTRYNVGDTFNNSKITRYISNVIPDIEKMSIVIDGTVLKINTEKGKYVCTWALDCQTSFLIIDNKTNKVLFTSKEYSRKHREDPACNFYDELRYFFRTIGNSTTFEIYDGPDCLEI